MEYTLNLHGRLFPLATPQVMGIVNVTPNSFYAASRVQTASAICARVRQIEQEGGTMVDIGACSTNPYLDRHTTEQEEMAALDMALTAIREMGTALPLSVDTYRASVARRCIEHYQVDIINDVATGSDPDMFPLVAETGTPYILMPQETRHGIDAEGDGREDRRAAADWARKTSSWTRASALARPMDENLRMLRHVDRLPRCWACPVLVGHLAQAHDLPDAGASPPTRPLNGTTVLNTIALMRGAAHPQGARRERRPWRR